MFKLPSRIQVDFTCTVKTYANGQYSFVKFDKSSTFSFHVAITGVVKNHLPCQASRVRCEMWSLQQWDPTPLCGTDEAGSAPDTEQKAGTEPWLFV